MNVAASKSRADTRPTKQVIHDLTKDITTEACIFDLIDNAIDALSEDLSKKNHKDCKVELFLDSKSFTIQDKGIGIPREKLENSALRFGSLGGRRSSIGVFGVGLNRALFKLGKNFKITSETKQEKTSISLDTDEYFSHDDWHIPIVDEGKGNTTGTTIEINELTSDSTEDFSSSKWMAEFKYHIQRRYEKFLNEGLEIAVNQESIKGHSVDIREADFPILTWDFSMDEVEVSISAGQHHLHMHPYEAKKSGRKKDNDKGLTEEYGWTVYCNDRAVLFSDRKKHTGISGKFHGQHYGFVGKVNFTGKSHCLPWNTSKTGVDLNNATYQKALVTMEEFYEKWRSHTSLVKKGKFDKQEQLPLPETTPETTNASDTSEPSDSNINYSNSNNNQSQGSSHNIPPHPFDQEYLFGRSATSRIDFKIPSSETKLCAIVKEISRLEIKKNPFSIALLLRVFLELSLGYFQKQNPKFQPKRELPLREKVLKCTDFMQNKGLLTNKHEIDAIKSLCPPRGKGMITIEYLQKTIHSDRSMLPDRGLLAFWNDIHPFIRACFNDKH